MIGCAIHLSVGIWVMCLLLHFLQFIFIGEGIEHVFLGEDMCCYVLIYGPNAHRRVCGVHMPMHQCMNHTSLGKYIGQIFLSQYLSHLSVYIGFIVISVYVICF